MTAVWVRSRAEFEALAPAWDEAIEASGTDNPFVLSQFLLLWAETFTPHSGLRVLVLRQGGAIVGGLPLFVSRRRRWPREPRLRMAGLGFANYTEPFRVAEAAAGLGAAVGRALRGLPGWSWLHLPLQRQATGAEPGWWAQTGLRWYARPAGSSGRVVVPLTSAAQSAGEYFAALRPGMQANLRRSLRLAAAAGPVRLVRETDPARVAAMIEFQLRHNGPGRYPPEEELGATRAQWAAFTRRLLTALAAHGRLDAMALYLGEALAAVGFGFRHGAGYKSLLTAYDPRFRACGPGFVFFHHLIDWCCANGEPCLEMYADADEFEKRRWCNQRLPLVELRLFAPTVRGRLLAAAARSRGW